MDPIMKHFFDRVVCINLDRRGDRWHRFQDNVASAGWPFVEIERFSAVDGHKVPSPGWWRAGGGAWGCAACNRTRDWFSPATG